MRKIVTLSTVVAASLMVAACGGSQPAATDNTVGTEMNDSAAMEGTATDNMTNLEATTGEATGMPADANASMPATEASAGAAPAEANGSMPAAAPAEDKKN